MRNKVLGCLGIGAFVLLIVSVFLNLMLLLSNAGSGEQKIPKFRETFAERGSGEKKIVHIDLDGVISSVERGAFGGSMVDAMKMALRQAGEDAKVAAVVLRINSPGGEVTASDVIYNAVKNLNAKKPVIVHMDTVAASGGYYIACGAQKILANETTITGSIGVITAAPNYTGLMEKIGLDMMVFTSGAFKDTLRGSREMRPEERDYIQGHVNEIYEKFLSIVVEGRGLEESVLRGGLADGRIFSGSEAAEQKLVDGTGYIEDAYEMARTEGGAPEARVVRYQATPSFMDMLGIFGEAKAGANKLEVGISERLLPALEPGQVYLLPPSFVR